MLAKFRTRLDPAERLVVEREKLQTLAAPHYGRSVRSLKVMPPRKEIKGYKHPLSVYSASVDSIVRCNLLTCLAFL